MKARTFVDSATLYATGGSGGNGCVSFRREKFVPRGGPDGGDGGHGGSVILKADSDEDSLVKIYFSPHQRATDAGHGKGKNLHGRNGKDRVVGVPCGTEVWNADTGELLQDMVEHDTELLVARGGKGGLGNTHWKRSAHRAPREHTPGEPGESVTLRLELKLAADVGLVGYPNAGKSSLLTSISDAHPKVGLYPFTTLNPIVGTVVFEDYSRLKVADIPGLIEGAHRGIGLGHDFLRHIERSTYLVYVIDMAGADARNPWDDYASLCRELELHKQELATRPSVIVANKMDLEEAAPNLAEFTEKTGCSPLQISAVTGEGVDVLKEKLQELVTASR